MGVRAAGSRPRSPSRLISVSFSFLLCAVSSEVGSKDKLVQETGHPPSSGCSQARGFLGGRPRSRVLPPGSQGSPRRILPGPWQGAGVAASDLIDSCPWEVHALGRGPVWASPHRYLPFLSSFGDPVGWPVEGITEL